MTPELPPKRDEVLSPRTGLIAEKWLRWLAALSTAAWSAPRRECPVVTLDDQTGTASGTVPAPPLAAGVYRVSVGVSEPAAVTVMVTWGGAALTYGAVSTMGASWLVRVDAGSAVDYAITAAGPWDAAVLLERVEA